MAKVLVPLAQGCEELEAVTIIDLLRRAEMQVITASLDEKPIVASRGTKLLADTTLDQVINEEFDMIVLPGGLPGADNLNEDQRIHTILKNAVDKNNYVAAICAAPKVLVSAGLLNNKKATAYPGVLEVLKNDTVEITGVAVQQDGKVITSRGPGTAMDFALEIITCLLGDEKRKQVESALQRAA
ncbi:MAG: DJ-1/PfpI family protein [Gammaproteobacteria bacterium]|nr:DJ-1/PfpI family protein [Gammaproteobacteria bacterium]